MTTYGRSFDAFGDPTRRAILEALGNGPLSVGDLADRLPVSRPAVSQHLKVLKAAKLVLGRRSGRQRIYAVSPEGVALMREYLDMVWRRALAELKATAERAPRRNVR